MWKRIPPALVGPAERKRHACELYPDALFLERGFQAGPFDHLFGVEENRHSAVSNSRRIQWGESL
ncbi:MAG: hypothetical protein CMJ23_09935 [Phycisphaerae bacterium]|nr:hypothetical protein [Phycisphaerae bacterium]